MEGLFSYAKRMKTKIIDTHTMNDIINYNSIVLDKGLSLAISHLKNNDQIIMFVHTIKHAETIKDMLIQRGVSPSLIGLFMGSDDRAQARALTEACLPITIATYKKASKAVDFKWKNVLIFMSMPAASDLNQNVGRVERRAENKTQATVYHLNFMINPMIKSIVAKYTRYYNDEGYSVEYL